MALFATTLRSVPPILAGGLVAAAALTAQAPPPVGLHGRCGDVLEGADGATLGPREAAVHRKELLETLHQAPQDVPTLLTLGRLELTAYRNRRFDALHWFRRAAWAAPEDPEPAYWMGCVGVALLGADGEGIARRGLERVLTIDPAHEDAWLMWLRLYRGRRERERMLARLETRADDERVQTRMAWLLVEHGDCERAEPLLSRLASAEPGDPRWPAWQAECAFLAGDDTRGNRLYAHAVVRAASDSTEALWAQIRSLARPSEREAFDDLRGAARTEFLAGFWEHRDPNLFTTDNERVAEHFRRRAQARRRYQLRQPFALFHYSRTYRDIVSGLPDPGRAEEFEAAFPLGRNLHDQLDDRGLILLRHGEPQLKVVHSLDEEDWSYEASPGLDLRFARVLAPAPMTDMILHPATAAQASASEAAMTSDRSSLPAPIEFALWFAAFRADDSGKETELVVVTDSLRAAGALFGASGRGIARSLVTPGEALRLTAPAGEYLLGVDVARSDSLGRYRGRVRLRDLSGPGLVLSDVLLARGGSDPGGDQAPALDRMGASARALPRLTVPAGVPIVAYVELYGLAAISVTAIVSVEYELVRRRSGLGRLFGADATTRVRYDRPIGAVGEPVLPHALEIATAGLTPGTYTLRVRMRDPSSDAVAEAPAVEFRVIRP